LTLEETIMKKILSGLCASALALSFAATSILPAAAAPIFVPKTAQATSDVEQVQSRRYSQRHNNFERRGNNYYYNGHRGYRSPRRGYRNYNGWWFPATAFIAGAIISGAINNNNNYRYNNYSGGNAHVRWCYDRYRSYRASDNTFQPYNGPRRQCYSPYS
jgi:hypothetical protein